MMSMQDMQNISWASRLYNNIKKLVFSEVKLYAITIIVVSLLSQVLCHLRLKLCVAINYSFFFLLLNYLLTLISFTGNNCKCYSFFFFKKKPYCNILLMILNYKYSANK